MKNNGVITYYHQSVVLKEVDVLPIINQPFNGQLGEILIEKLTEPYNQLIMFSAFAKNSGVLRIKRSIEEFKANGGTVIAFVGVDMKGTSYEAILNLFNVCDDVYVVHSENDSTFHSKMYILKNDTCAWIAVGSNNLTGGGLWTNFESISCEEYDLTTNQGIELYSSIADLIALYTDDNYSCSKHIDSVEDINALLEGGYIKKEVKILLEKRRERTRTNVGQASSANIFGQQRASIPRLEPGALEVAERPRAVYRIVREDFANEKFWFQSRALTGGSRNILDLSKLGRIFHGSATGTRYETTDTQIMLGGVAFFDIDPENTLEEKNITINYNGQDYFPSTIKYPSGGRNPNGSWRLQLKGHNDTGEQTLSFYGGQGAFVHKILVFEKVRSDYYCLSVLDEDMLQEMIDNSQVVAYNGSSTSSRLFGML